MLHAVLLFFMQLIACAFYSYARPDKGQWPYLLST